MECRIKIAELSGKAKLLTRTEGCVGKHSQGQSTRTEETIMSARGRDIWINDQRKRCAGPAEMSGSRDKKLLTLLVYPYTVVASTNKGGCQMRWKDQPYKHADWLSARVAEGLKAHEIAELCSVAKCTIFKWGKRLKVPMLHWHPRTRKYDMNHHFFDTIDTEMKAYTLGLWAADGTVLSTGWEARIGLHHRDAAILETIKQGIQYTGELHPQKDGRVMLNLCSIDIVAGLAKQGILPCKTHTLPFLQFPDELMFHYLRGLFDGDGSVGNTDVRFVSGSQPFISGFLQWYETRYGMQVWNNCEVAPDTGAKKWRLVFNRRDVKFVKELYADATVYIQRKYDNYLKWWSEYVYRGTRPPRGPYRKRKP